MKKEDVQERLEEDRRWGGKEGRGGGGVEKGREALPCVQFKFSTTNFLDSSLRLQHSEEVAQFFLLRHFESIFSVKSKCIFIHKYDE